VRVDATHHLDLVVLLEDVGLVDTQVVDPEGHVEVLRAHLGEECPEVASDGDDVVVEFEVGVTL